MVVSWASTDSGLYATMVKRYPQIKTDQLARVFRWMMKTYFMSDLGPYLPPSALATDFRIVHPSEIKDQRTRQYTRENPPNEAPYSLYRKKCYYCGTKLRWSKRIKIDGVYFCSCCAQLAVDELGTSASALSLLQCKHTLDGMVAKGKITNIEPYPVQSRLSMDFPFGTPWLDNVQCSPYVCQGCGSGSVEVEKARIAFRRAW
jgi:hypothetical protein